MSFLRQHDVVKVYEFTPATHIGWDATSTARHRLYIVHANVRNARTIGEHFLANQRESAANNIQHRHTTIVFVPRKLNVCEMVLEEMG